MEQVKAKKGKANGAKTKKKETPLMGQFNAIKEKHPDAILLFRVGDFYETFGTDAVVASRVLGIVLTKRANGSASHVELAGFPHHSLDTYLPKLVKAGHRVAICDQLEDPKQTKTIVKRGVTELVTPGVTLNEQILPSKENNYLGSVIIRNGRFGLAFIDISTGEFRCAEGDRAFARRLLQGLSPREVIYPKSQDLLVRDQLGDPGYTYCMDDWVYQGNYTRERLLEHFRIDTLKGFGVEELSLAQHAAGAALQYLGETEHAKLSHVTRLQPLAPEGQIWLDPFTIRNLELLSPLQAGGKALVDVIDKSKTAMGGRLLRQWIAFPSADLREIHARQAAVQYLLESEAIADRISEILSDMADLERLAGKVATRRVMPREMAFLGRSLLAVDELRELLSEVSVPYLAHIGLTLEGHADLCSRITTTLEDEPAASVEKGEVIRQGVNPELDDLRDLLGDTKARLAALQQQEASLTGISSLKVGFNNVFGYYLEVSNTHKDKVPDSWIRKQTLVNAERYVTPELKAFEEKILGATDRIQALETELYRELVEACAMHVGALGEAAHGLARLDTLAGFAALAVANSYTRPDVHDGMEIRITAGRHPVIEAQLPEGEVYIPNDLHLDHTTQQILLITGPNMAGKSAVLRQTALITLMAQIGCWVPASSAEIGLVDRIFTRVGASDNISSGESTFMVEMNETASIVNNLSPRSLVLLDEIGRGTSTFDGIAIAWSLAEFLHEHPEMQARTLFATHYHELTALSERFARLKNYNISTRETSGKVLFLRKLEPGSCTHSFGIHVAQMAGLPSGIVRRAKEVMHQLEQKSLSTEGPQERGSRIEAPAQLSLFHEADPKAAKLVAALAAIDINTLTPLEALMKLKALQEMS